MPKALLRRVERTRRLVISGVAFTVDYPRKNQILRFSKLILAWTRSFRSRLNVGPLECDCLRGSAQNPMKNLRFCRDFRGVFWLARRMSSWDERSQKPHP